MIATMGGDESQTRRLMEAVSRGEGPAIDELIARQLPRLRAFVRLHMSPELRLREASSDVVQSVCRELVEDLGRFDYRGEGRFRAWLFTAALNKIREKYRFHHRAKRDLGREQRASVPQPSEDLLAGYQTMSTPSQNVAASEEVARIEAAFDRLPEDHRQVITLARIVGLPHAEIAVRMERTVGAMRQLLGRALIKLNNELRSGAGDPD